jgi:hypothetical protein
MDGLNFIQRGEAKLYCFIEVCDKLFHSFSRSAVRSWLKQLNIMTVYATLEERRAFKALNPKLKSTVFGLLYENDLNLLVNESKHKRSKKKLDDETRPFGIGMANRSIVEYTDESSDDEQLTPGIAVAMDTSSPPNHKIASPIRMPIATAVSSNVTPNISAATVTSRNLSNSESLVRSSAAVCSTSAFEIAEDDPSTDVNESAPAIPPKTKNQSRTTGLVSGCNMFKRHHCSDHR